LLVRRFTRRRRGPFIRPISPSSFAEAVKKVLSRQRRFRENLGRSRQRSFKDRASGERCRGVEVYCSTAIRTTYKRASTGRYATFPPRLLPSAFSSSASSSISFRPEYRRDESASSVAAISRACGERYRVSAVSERLGSVSKIHGNAAILRIRERDVILLRN